MRDAFIEPMWSLTAMKPADFTILVNLNIMKQHLSLFSSWPIDHLYIGHGSGIVIRM